MRKRRKKDVEKDKLNILLKKMQAVLNNYEKSEFHDFFNYYSDISNRKRMIYTSLINGVARGAGYAFGFTVIGAVIIILLQRIAKANLPLIGDFIADIVRIVEYKVK